MQWYIFYFTWAIKTFKQRETNRLEASTTKQWDIILFLSIRRIETKPMNRL